jgi:nitrous oxide reductase accessory protein NosL
MFLTVTAASLVVLALAGCEPTKKSPPPPPAPKTFSPFAH